MFIKKFSVDSKLGVTLGNLGFPVDWKDRIFHIKNDLPRTSQERILGLEEGRVRKILSKKQVLF